MNGNSMASLISPNGDDVSPTGNSGPWWIQLAKTFGWQVGLIVVLVFFIAKDVREAQAATLAALHAQSLTITELRSSITELRTTSADLRATMEAIRRILSVMCSESVRDARSVGCIQ